MAGTTVLAFAEPGGGTTAQRQRYNRSSKADERQTQRYNRSRERYNRWAYTVSRKEEKRQGKLSLPHTPEEGKERVRKVYVN